MVDQQLDIRALRLALVLGLSLLATLLAGQDAGRIRLINSAERFTPSVVAAQSARLNGILTAEDIDVRFSFVTNFAPIPDRWEGYDGEVLVDFLRIPFNADGTITESGVRDYNTTVMNYVAGSPEPVGPRTLHLIYSTVFYLDGVSQDRQIHSAVGAIQGEGLTRLERLKIAQAAPLEGEDLRSEGTPAENDAWLTAYVDRLVEALTDPGYVVTGTIKVGDDIHLDGDTVYLGDQYSEPWSEFSQNGLIPLELLVNQRSDVQVSWEDRSPMSVSPSILHVPVGQTADLRIHRVHYENYSKLVASYGTEQATLYVLPVNLQTEQSADRIEPNEATPVIFKIFNNHVPFEFGSTGILGMTPQTSLTNSNHPVGSLTVFPGEPAEFTFLRDQECDLLRFWIHFDDSRQEETIAERNDELVIECPFPLDHIVLSEMDGDSPTQRKTVQDNDTLWVIGESLTWESGINASLKIPPAQGGRSLSLVDFWDNSGVPDRTPEPIWFAGLDHIWTDSHFSSGDRNESDRNYEQDPPEFTATLSKNYTFASPFPSTVPVPALDYFPSWVNPIQVRPGLSYYRRTYRFTARAFETNTATSFVTFLNEDRRESEWGIPALNDWVNNAMKPGLERFSSFVNGILGTNLTIEGNGISATMTTFNQEHDASPDYDNVVEYGGSIGLTFFTGPITAQIPPYSGRLPFNAGEYGLYFDSSIGLAGGLEVVRSKVFYGTDYDFTGGTVEAVLFGAIEGGIKLELSPQLDDIVQVTIGAAIELPSDLKYKWEYDLAESKWYRYAYFSLGPLYFKVPVSIILLPNSGEFEWELIDKDFKWSLTTKFETDTKVEDNLIGEEIQNQ